MNFQDDIHKEAMHDYDPIDDRPTEAEIEREMSEDDVRRALRCPYCHVSLDTLYDETHHMITVHRDTVMQRLGIDPDTL